MIASKSRLAIILSKLKVFDAPDLQSEQYPTDSEIAAETLWDAHYQDEIEGKIIADFGCGTGILGLGAALLGAKVVFMIEKDEKALEIAKENYESLKEDIEGEIKFLHQDVQDFNERVDVLIQNPPFGTKEKHADRDFLMKAFDTANTIYTFHKTTSENFIKKISQDNNFKVTYYKTHNFPLKAAHLFHTRKIHRIKVGCWRLESEKLTKYQA
ncbi:methyltransferase [Candidatus Woesearchaeota archaeon]|jgi:putative methylase|nr:methyltransferase [Candidatus Woesearchaeota archaeon]MBT3538297.1 methyltransferase [Candidatus Woesearchaeota archaeon]MBT4696709.1 methyltransferase [Candidatus Woesearchaeota archaeon]MBT4716827.1 methyltransferase [Candidatus Woesearchaeota archaeon]MBT7105966.1 methyltransferase [Candidatus Woesearchaeota archaeon]